MSRLFAAATVKVAKPRTLRGTAKLAPCTTYGYEHNVVLCPRCGDAREDAKAPRKRPRAIEDAHQTALFRWATLQAGAHPELAMLMHVPNGGARNAREGKRLKAQGVRRGYPDIVLDVARGGYFGLRIELKAPSSELGRAPHVTPDQHEWLDRLTVYGYRAAVCVGWEAARDELLHYLSLPRTTDEWAS